MDRPSLSVVMPVHNALPWLDESVQSILRQVDGDFEFVILDDGSTDGSRETLRAWAKRDARIRLVECDRRLGPVGSSNRVVAESRGGLVARMDADDVARPDRLKLQRALLERHANVVLVGSLVEIIDAQGKRVRGPDYPRLLRASRFAPMSHPTAMFRRSAFDQVGGYREAAALWEDVDLYLRMAGAGQVLTVAEPLVRTRHWRRSSRLSGGAGALVAAMTRMYREVEDRPDDRVPPEAVVASGSVAVWAGCSPQIFGEMRRSADLGWSLRSLKALVWAAWADLSPRTLRFALARVLGWRSKASVRKLGGATVFEWRPGEVPRPLG